MTIETNFNEPDDTAGSAVGDQSICGPKTYEVVYDDYTAQTLVTIETVTADTEHKLTSVTNDENDEGVHSLLLRVMLASTDYDVLEVPFTLTISPATCDCRLLDWIMPGPQSVITTVLKDPSDTLALVHPTVDATTKDTTPAIRACYRTDLGPAPGCDETTTIN